MASAVAPGTPASSAIPSFGPSANSASPCSASAPAAGLASSPVPSTCPIPASGPKACASGMISPALPAPVRGTAGTMPSFRKSASRWQSAPDTAASPERNVRSRTAKSARTSAAASQGGPPLARASSRLRWCTSCCGPVRRTPASAPMPVVTPYTGSPPRSTARPCSHRCCTSPSRAGASRTAALACPLAGPLLAGCHAVGAAAACPLPSAISQISAGSRSAAAVTVSVIVATGNESSCRHRPPRPGAG